MCDMWLLGLFSLDGIDLRFFASAMSLNSLRYHCKSNASDLAYLEWKRSILFWGLTQNLKAAIQVICFVF